MKKNIVVIILVLTSILNAQNEVKRNPDNRKDFVNVFYNEKYTLFDLWSDEPIFPDNNGNYNIYIASNESKIPKQLIAKSSVISATLFYKFKNYENCKNWCDGKVYKPIEIADKKNQYANTIVVNEKLETQENSTFTKQKLNFNEYSSNYSEIIQDKPNNVLVIQDKNIPINKTTTNPEIIQDKPNNVLVIQDKNIPINKTITNPEDKIKVIRVKEKNISNNYPILIEVYDKLLNLKVGDNVLITKIFEVKIPGEKKKIKSETTIAKAKIIEDYNKPLYTAKLFGNDGFKMKDYIDGDENYRATIGEANTTIIASPKIMVIPKKIDQSKFVNGEYELGKEEKMLISAFKNNFENYKYTTYGFESSLKSIIDNRQINDNVLDDIKSRIIESTGMDFFVEYENLDQNNAGCIKVYDFKIRNYSTGEDIASDVKSLNSCGNPEDYKFFASSILNTGAISKINSQFSSLLNNGRKVNVIFTISDGSQTTFNTEFHSIKLKDHIENCLQGLAFNGNMDIDGVVNLRMETSVNIPIINENSGKSYTTNTFSEDIIKYLNKNANVECESIVNKQIVNIKIK